MVESSGRPAATPLQAELSAVDVLAVFEYTDQNIYGLGNTLDGLQSQYDLSDNFLSSLREVVNRLNEPDLVPTAFDAPVQWAHPQSQERFTQLRQSQDLEQYLTATNRTPATQERLKELHLEPALSEYLHLSQTQSDTIASAAYGATQSSSSSSSLQPPAPKQHQRQRQYYTSPSPSASFLQPHSGHQN
ncbi:hypothetical protein CF319_g8043 [Tilletia indica]|nr:hypothetical protein CF319_g8043 [Tilletia indica]